jgi:hypothetical protein
VVKISPVFASLSVALALVAGSACSRQPSSSAASGSATPAATMPPPGVQQSTDTVDGVVLETMDASNYTYMRLQTPKGEIWTATAKTPVKVGDKVSVSVQTEMRDFHSPSLNRTFPVIYFASRAGQAGASGQPPMSVGHGTDGMPVQSPVSVKPMAPPPGGSSIADVWANRASLVGKMVTINGTVVKFNGGILGRNWIHLQDGSGSAADGTNDITVTTDAVANVGDVITVTGTVAADKDIGAGYVYKVMLEGGKIK